MTAPNTSPIASDAALLRRHPVFLDMPLDVLDHDNRVVDDDAGGENDAEERQRVDGEAHQLDERERADERHRNRDRRDERRPPALEKQEHHQDDEHDRLDERDQDLADRLGDDLGRVEGDLVLQSGREMRARAGRARPAPRAPRRARWPRAAAMTPKPTASIPWNRSCEPVRFGAELDRADVLQADERRRRAALTMMFSNSPIS